MTFFALVLIEVSRIMTYKIPANFAKFKPLVDKWLKTYGLPRHVWPTFYSLIDRESDWDPNSFRAEYASKWGTLPDGTMGNDASYGLCQILQKTAAGVGFSGYNFDLYDPDTNIKYGAKHFVNLYNGAKGYVPDVLSRYNSGKSYANAPDHTKQVYIPDVMRLEPVYSLADQEGTTT